jgi:hypothetical protein
MPGVLTKNQCCGNGTGSAGTVNFFLSGTGMRYGSRFVSGSGSGAGFGSKSNIKSKKSKKNQKLEANFLGNNVASDNKKARFCTNFIL